MTGALAPERSVDTDAPDLELTLPARPENVAVARHAIGGFADVLDVPDQTLADVKLAVTEACTNVVVHAYPDGEGPLGVSAWVRDERAVHDLVRGPVVQPRHHRHAAGIVLEPRVVEAVGLWRLAVVHVRVPVAAAGNRR